MKPIHKIITFYIPLFLLSKCLFAQTDLPSLIELADAQYAGFKWQDERISQAKQLALGMKITPETQFQVQYGNIQNPGVADYVLGANHTIINPLKNKTIKSLYANMAGNIEAEKGLYRSDLHQTIRLLYLKCVYLQQQNEIFAKEKVQLEELKKYADARVNAGETDALESIQIDAQLLQISANIANQIAQKESLLLELSHFTNTSTLSNLKLAYPILSEYNLENNPELKWLDQQKITAQAAMDHDQSLLKPDYTFGLANQSMLGRFNQFFVSAGINIPLDKSAQKAKVLSSKMDVDLKLHEIEIHKAAIENKLNAQKMEYQALEVAIFKQKNEIYPMLESLLAKAEKRYRASEISFFEFNQLRRLKIENDLKINELAYSKALIVSDIDRLLGK